MAATVNVDVQDLIHYMVAMNDAPPQIQRAVVRTVNYAGDRGFTASRRELAKQTGIPVGDMNRSRGITKRLARPDNMTYAMIARSRWTPLSYFKPVQRKRGVSARPWGTRRVFRGSFLGKMPSGFEGVFVRVRGKLGGERVGKRGRPLKPRPALKQLWGPSLSVEMTRDAVPTTFRVRVRQVIEERLPHEVDFALDRIKQRTEKRGRAKA